MARSSSKKLKKTYAAPGCFITVAANIAILSLWLYLTLLSSQSRGNITNIAAHVMSDNKTIYNINASLSYFDEKEQYESAKSAHNYSKVNASDLLPATNFRGFVDDILVSRENKILYCGIRKNGCSVFKWLFTVMETHDDKAMDKYKQGGKHGNIHAIFDKKFLISSKSEKQALNTYADYLNDKSWRKLIVIRDPLERLLSGYLDKCVNHEMDCFGFRSNITHSDKQLKNKNEFSIFVNHLKHGLNKWKNHHKDNLFTAHFRWQYTYCEAQIVLDHFTDIIYYDHSTIADDVLRFLQSLNINIDWFLNWGSHQNETMFESFKTNHITHNDSTGDLMDRVNFYGQYYDKELANDVVKFFEEDYKFFNITPPKWVDLL